MIAYKHNALAVMAAALAAAIMPVEPIAPSAWAENNLIVADGPHAGSLIDLSLTPYWREPLNMAADACPDNKDVTRKSKQVGASEMGICVIGYSIDVEPADLFLVEPTDANLKEFTQLKLNPTIEASPSLKAKVREQRSRSGKGSTGKIKRFPGGNLLTAIATSSADLRGKTRKKVIRDEVTEYPEDLGGQGSPHDMITGSYETFLASADYKDWWISTPGIKGACAISAEFEGGDQRYWHVRCPHCCDEALTPDEIFAVAAGADDVRAALRAIGVFYFEWAPKNFVFKQTYPYDAHYVAPCCGAQINYLQRTPLVRVGIGPDANGDALGWIPTAPAPGKYRSRHVDAFSSPFVPWDVIAKRIVDAGTDPAKLKTLYNLTLGLPFEVKGDAPDHARLMERREDYEAERIPARGLLLVAGADVQHSGIWVEVVAFASNGESWSLTHRFLEGDTSDPQGGAFLALDVLYNQQFPDAFGATRLIDAMAIDAGDGGRFNQVCAWARARARAFAIKGAPGWTHPAIGTPAKVDIRLSGRKVRGGAMLWPVGTWSLKATFYANLNKEGRKAGHLVDPPGYCHHHMACDERYFRQQTAEYLKTSVVRGRSTRVWHETGPNHLLDCRIYAMAMAEYLGLSRNTADQWAQLAALRGVPAELKEPDLLAPDAVKIAAPPVARPALIGNPAPRQARRMRGQAVI